MNEETLNLQEILDILRRQRRLIIMTMLLTVGVAMAYLMTATPIFQATALVRIETRGADLLDTANTDTQQSATLNSMVDSEVEIMNSQATAMAVIDAAGLMSDPEFGPTIGRSEKLLRALGLFDRYVGLRRQIGLPLDTTLDKDNLVLDTARRYASALEVRRRGLTYLIAVSVASKNPERAAELANLTASIYVDRQVAQKVASALTARDVIRRQLETARNQLSSSEAALNSYIEDNLARIEAESGDQQISSLRRELDESKSLQSEVASKVDRVQSVVSVGDWGTLANTLGDKALEELANQRQTVERRLGRVAADSPDAEQIRRELAAIDQRVNDAATNAMSAMKSQLDTLNARVDTARDALRSNLSTANLSPTTLAELFNLQQTATVARNQYQTLLAREQDFGAMANLQLPDARIASEAFPPTRPSFPNTRLILVMAIVASLGIGVGLAFLNEYYIGGVTSGSQLHNLLQAPVPVTVPAADLRSDRTSVANIIVDEPLSNYAETFRKLKSSVDFSLRDLPPKADGLGTVIAVCSALPSEGKTTTALSLARTYAMSGRTTLLLEGDLRRPSIEGYLGTVFHNEESVTLLQHLQGTTDRPDAPLLAQRDPVSSLLVVPAGGRSSTPTDELLGSAKFRQIVRYFATSFDVVVIDTPPILPIADTRNIVPLADVIVHVVRFANTRQQEVRDAAAQLREVAGPSCKFIAVLSQEPVRKTRYGYYGYRYGRYGSYGSYTS